MLNSLWKLSAFSALLASSKAQYSALADPAAACATLAAKISIENVTVNFASYIAAGTNISLPDFPTAPCYDGTGIVVSSDLCRVSLKVATSDRSEITMEAWLPTNWTGRFLSTGNGGLAGCIQFVDLNYAAQQGFASVGANNGHNGTSGKPFYNNPDIVEDFAYRSVHTGVVVGKQVSELYYEEAHNKSYYLGCSTGGRQGLKSVQDFPEDFDGVIAGAPAIAYANLTSWSGHFYPITGGVNASTFISSALWAIIRTEILNQCDGLDGSVDGIIEDPDLCYFRPEALQCAPGNTTSCLTGTQVQTVRALYSDWYGVNGSLIYPRMQPGGSPPYFGGSSFTYTDEWFKYALYNDPSWDPSTLSIQDAANNADANLFDIMTWKGDLSAFQSRGGKLIHWHGLQDPIISSDNSPRYYNHVSQTMNLPTSSLDDFYRYFRISGANHCSGGPGAWQIGQTSAGARGQEVTPDNNVLRRIVEWVESGSAPTHLTGTKFINDDPNQGPAIVRKHCKYPLRNKCIDPANTGSPDAWVCV